MKEDRKIESEREGEELWEMAEARSLILGYPVHPLRFVISLSLWSPNWDAQTEWRMDEEVFEAEGGDR